MLLWKIRPLRQIRLLLVILCLGILKIGNQQKKVRIYTEEMQKLPAFLGISMSLGWKTGEVDQKIHEKYQGVEAGAYLRVCEILENLSMDSRIWSLMRCGQSLHL